MSSKPDGPVSRTDDDTSDTPWTPLLRSADELAQQVWLERALFSHLGRWAASSDQPAATVHLGAQSRRHGWHAQLFYERLPELSVIEPDDLVRAPGASTEALVTHLSSLEHERAAVQLAVHNRVVLPRLVNRYRRQLAGCSSVADSSTARWLRIVIADDLEEWADGEAVLAELVRDEATLTAVLGAHAAAERFAGPAGQLDR